MRGHRTIRQQPTLPSFLANIRDGRLSEVSSALSSLSGAEAASWLAQQDPRTGKTALHVACMAGHAKIARMLISSGAEVRTRGREGARTFQTSPTTRHTAYRMYATRTQSHRAGRSMRRRSADARRSASLAWRASGTL